MKTETNNAVIILGEIDMEKLIITDVKVDQNIAQVTLSGVKDEPGNTYKVFRCLSDEGIIVDMILQSAKKEDHMDIIFTIARDNADGAVDILMSKQNLFEFEHIDCNKEIAKVTLSGAGLMSHSDIVPRVLSCFHQCNAPMDVISTSEIAIKVFTDKKKTKRVVDKIRDEFID